MKLAGKTFRAISNSANGTLNSQTQLTFVSDGEVLLGVYGGGTIATGNFVGQRTGDDTIQMLYHCITVSGELRAGHAYGEFRTGADGEWRMYLDWQWLTGDRSQGRSEWVLVQAE